MASGARAGIVLAAASDALGRSLSELDELAGPATGADVTALVRSLEAGDEPDVPEASPGEIWKGMLVALAERTVEAAERVEALLGPARRMLVFGGGSRSRPWMEAKANASARPVFRVATEQAVARGAAVFAGVAAGWWQSPEDAPTAPLEAVSA